MGAQQTRLDVTANNIANVATPGFKKSRVEFEDLMYQVGRQPGALTSGGSRAPSGTEIGMGVKAAGTERMHVQGDIRETGNALDVAIEGHGFFGIRTPSGELAYTRAGNFKLDAEGRLVNGDGLPLDTDISIPPDSESVMISADGIVSVKIPGETLPIEAGRIQLSTFPNPNGLQTLGRNLLRETVASGAPLSGVPGQNGTGALAQGFIEGSNVQIVEEMVDLIAGQRAYEVNTRVIRAADEMLQNATNLR
jgi:flagellar basal-body rod protein FlgG